MPTGGWLVCWENGQMGGQVGGGWMDDRSVGWLDQMDGWKGG